jgi:hypothetical protein
VAGRDASLEFQTNCATGKVGESARGAIAGKFGCALLTGVVMVKAILDIFLLMEQVDGLKE